MPVVAERPDQPRVKSPVEIAFPTREENCKLTNEYESRMARWDSTKPLASSDLTARERALIELIREEIRSQLPGLVILEVQAMLPGFFDSQKQQEPS
jgi:hypothetical protein